MKKYFLEFDHFQVLHKCLEFLFSQNCTRFSTIQNKEFPEEIFKFSCQIYKRGMISQNPEKKISNEFKIPKVRFFGKDDLESEFQNIAHKHYFIIVDNFFFTLMTFFF